MNGGWQEQAHLAPTLPRLAQRHSLTRYLWPDVCSTQSSAFSTVLPGLDPSGGAADPRDPYPSILKSEGLPTIRWLPTGTPGLPLLHTSVLAVAGHCRDATALHGRQRSLWQMEGADRGVERGQRTRSSLNARSTCRPPRFPRNLATYHGRVVRALLSRYNNDPLQLMCDCVRVAAPRAHGRSSQPLPPQKN